MVDRCLRHPEISVTILPLRRLCALLGTTMSIASEALRRLHPRLLASRLVATILRARLFLPLVTLLAAILRRLRGITMIVTTEAALLLLRRPTDMVLTLRPLPGHGLLLVPRPPALLATTTIALLLGTLFLCAPSGSCLDLDVPVITPLLTLGAEPPLPRATTTLLVQEVLRQLAIGSSPLYFWLAQADWCPSSRRSQSPPPRSASGAPYDSAGYGAGSGGAAYNGTSGGYANGYPGGAPPPPRSSGGSREYAPPRAREPEPAGSYRRA